MGTVKKKKKIPQTSLNRGMYSFAEESQIFGGEEILKTTLVIEKF